MKLKLRVEKFERAIAIQILEMDERFRANETVNAFYANVVIRSTNSPDLDAYTPLEGGGSSYELHLRGRDNDADHDLITYTFSSNHERDVFLLDLRKSLEDWARNWGGWVEKYLSPESNVWEF